MFCVCENKESHDLSIQERVDRETMLSVMISLGLQPLDFVIRVFDTKERAEKYIVDIKKANELIKKSLK